MHVIYYKRAHESAKTMRAKTTSISLDIPTLIFQAHISIRVSFMICHADIDIGVTVMKCHADINIGVSVMICYAGFLRIEELLATKLGCIKLKQTHLEMQS